MRRILYFLIYSIGLLFINPITSFAATSKFYIGGGGTAYNSLSEAEAVLKAKGDPYKPLTLSDKWRENGKIIYKYTAPFISPTYGQYTYSYHRCEKTGAGYNTEQIAANTGAQLVYNNDATCGSSIVQPYPGTTWGTSATPTYLNCGVSYYPYPNVDTYGKYGIELNVIDYKITYNKRSNDSSSNCYTGSDGLYIKSQRRADCPLGYTATKKPTLPISPDNTSESVLCTNNNWDTIHEVLVVDEVKNTNTCPTIGNPILPSIGSKIQKEIDYVSSGVFPLKITRTYNSLWSSYRTFWPLPQNLSGMWMHNYQAKIAKIKNSKSLYDLHIFRPNGTILYFTQSQTNVFQPYDKDINDTLTVTSIGGISFWQYYDAITQNTELYNLDGQLRQIKNLAGATQYLSYNVDGTLKTVIDPTGRSLTFSYDSNQLINSITLPDQGVLKYTYNSNGMLDSVAYPDNTKKTYQYESATFPTHLTGITDENNKRFATFSYDTQGHAISTEHAGGVDKYSVVYNTDGSSTVTDALGASRTYTFAIVQGMSKLDTLTQPCNTCNGSSQKTTYDTNGNVASRLDFKGNLTKYTYDLSRNLETIRVEGLKTDGTATAQTRTTTTEWHGTLRSPKRIAKPRQIITYIYNGDNGVTCGATAALCSKTIQETNDTNGSLGLTATATTTPARSWTYAYNASGQVLTVDGSRTDVSDKTTYTYYNDITTTHQVGDLWKITNALGQVTSFDSYDANGRPVSITDINGLTTNLTYSTRGLLKTTSIGGGVTTTYSYDNNQLLSKVTYPDGREYTYGYDDAQRLTSITSKTGEKTTYTLDLMGNHLKEVTTNSSGVVTQSLTQEFNSLSQLQKVITSIQGTNATTAYTYDNAGNLDSETNPLGSVTMYAYDSLSRLVSNQVTADTKSLTTQFEYNAQNLAENTKAPNNVTTTKTYNGFGEVLTEISPDRGTTVYTYDTAGNLKTRKDARNITLTYTYDVLNRLTQVSSSSNDVINYVYDVNGGSCTFGKGRLCKVTDSSGTTEYVYNMFGDIAKRIVQISGLSYSTQFFYDTNGRLNTLIIPTNRYAFYTRNLERRVSSLDALVNNTYTGIFSNATYRPDNLLTSVTLGNGVGFQYTYDTSGYRTNTEATGITSSSVFENYTWDLAGNFKNRFSSSANGGYYANNFYSYDGFSRLKQESGTPTAQAFTYDDNSNRLSNGTNSYVYVSSTNRLQSRNTALPTLDNAGNTLTNGYGQTYTWDSFGRLLSVATTNGTTQYQYNYLNQRVSKTLSNGTKIIYHYDNDGRLILETSSAGVMQAWYLYNDNGQVVAIIYGANSPYNATAQEQVLYLHSDHLGTPRIATDLNKKVVWRWESDAFGTTIPMQDPDGDGQATLINLRFPGQYYDAESKLHYNWNRYYDPVLGRYISSDPIGLEGGLNTFGYVNQTPLISIDPFGLETYICTRPLKGAEGLYWLPKVNHTYVCVGDTQSKMMCGSTTASNDGVWQNIVNGSSGRPTKPEDDYYRADSCERRWGQDSCIESCISYELKKPSRPWYAVGSLGTDCQEYTWDVVYTCEKRCVRR